MQKPSAKAPVRPLTDTTPGRSRAAIALELLASDKGLSAAEAAARLQQHGPNVLKASTGSQPFLILLNQFRSPMVIVLLAAAALSFGLGQADEATIIALIVLGSSGLSFFQEFRASNTVAALQKRLALQVKVLRDDRQIEVPTSEIVPGDVIVLASGSLVPADGILLQSTELQVDEAALTGESFPASRFAAEAGAPAGKDNFVHMGTSVRSGSAMALVVRTGVDTDYGAIAKSVGKVEPETSFAKGIRDFSLLMTKIMLVIVTLVFAVNLLLGRPLLDSLLFAAALAVGLTPELLPAIVTVTLARGAQKLALSGVLVKRLVSIENLGAMDVLCVDKTGTLTEGDVRLDRAVGTDGNQSSTVLDWAYLNASLQTGMPNALDVAVISAKPDPSVGKVHKLAELPYDFDRKRLSVLVGGDGDNLLVTKGAVAAMLPACSTINRAGTIVALAHPDLELEETRLADWSSQGLRVIAVATKVMTTATKVDIGDESAMTLQGYLLFSDPPKLGIAQTIASLADRGVRLKIITGDNRYVAAHLAAQVGIANAKILNGEDIAKLSHRALMLRAARTDLFAETTPDQKERIIAALRRAHRVVGYMGDGINDAPALRAADLGISVDNAVEAARDAADIVLLERDLNVLLKGIVIGRAAFGNTLKYISITTSANLGNMISMAVASLALPFLPLLAKQILLNNFLSDLPLLTVSTDKVDDEVVKSPGLWDFPKLLRAMLAFGVTSSVFDGITFAILLLAFHADVATFQTAWFVESLLTELAIVAVMRTRRPVFKSLPSPLLIWTSVAAAVLAFALPYLPLGEVTGFRRLSFALMLTVTAVVLAYVATSEGLKLALEYLPWRGTFRPRRHPIGLRPIATPIISPRATGGTAASRGP